MRGFGEKVAILTQKSWEKVAILTQKSWEKVAIISVFGIIFIERTKYVKTKDD